MHLRRSQLRSASGGYDARLLSAFTTAEAAPPSDPPVPALAPARGALLGSALGAVCWAVIASAVWLLFYA
jgi:hypothetical protein